MTRGERGVVLLNALVVVLAIAGIASALMLRAETARLRGTAAQGSAQLELYLDAAERLVPPLIEAPATEGIVHKGQAWAAAGLRFPIDRGSVAVEVVDLQGRLNVNWLVLPDDYVRGVFAEVFRAAGVSQALIAEIEAFVSYEGPRGLAAYRSRPVPVRPAGGPVRLVDELRAVEGMTRADFMALRPYLAALPVDSRVNLNTAPDVLKRAVLAPLPQELFSEVMAREAPVLAMADLRRRAIEILETEAIEHLPFDRLTIGSAWFRADLHATLDGAEQRRSVVYAQNTAVQSLPQVVRRWAVYD